MKKRGKQLITSKKSQISIFILIALMILLAGVVYFFYQNQASNKKAENIPPELVPVKEYVENCIASTAKDGLERIGFTGGYISIPKQINEDPRAYLSALPSSGLKLPYWWHKGIDSAPSEDFVNQQLKGHIKNSLKSCINNFQSFSSRFNINELKEPAVEVKFNDEDTSVQLSYPLEIISKDGKFRSTIENFNYDLPIRFKKIFGLAKLIMERENKDYFLEQRTIDLYSMDTDIPTTDIEASCTSKVWQLSSIKSKLQTLLRVNLPYIKIQGTSYNPNLYVPSPDGKNTYSQSYFQHHYIWELSQDKNAYKDMKVAFNYDNWPLSIYARPSQNGILKSDSEKGTEMLKFFCLHIWHFTYDIEYPVVATIFDGQGQNKYQFSFAFAVDIDHNQPNRVNKGAVKFEAPDDLSSQDYCNNVQNQITFYTLNNATGEGVSDVNMTFVCGRFYCSIGQSNWLSFGASAGITKRIPYCFNGVVKTSKEGFMDSESFAQSDVDGRSYLLFLNPVKEISNYKVVKHMLSNPSVAQELGPNEKASIYIKSNQTSFESFAVYPQEAQFPLKLPDSKDGIYNVDVYITDGQNIVGGYTGTLKLSKDDLSNVDNVIFHAIAQDPANDDERALFIAGLDAYSKKVPAPEFNKKEEK